MEQLTHPVSSSFPAATLNGEHPIVVNSVNWEQWLSMLRTLPADAPEWDGMVTFVKAVQQLGEAKRLERDSIHRLRQTLMGLAAHCSDGLNFFGLTGQVLEWAGETCLPAEVATLVATVETLRGLLEKHWAMYQKPTAATLAGERARRQALLELENDVSKAYDRLAWIFRTAHTVPPSEPTSQHEAEQKTQQDPAEDPQQKSPHQPHQETQQQKAKEADRSADPEPQAPAARPSV